MHLHTPSTAFDVKLLVDAVTAIATALAVVVALVVAVQSGRAQRKRDRLLSLERRAERHAASLAVEVVESSNEPPHWKLIVRIKNRTDLPYRNVYYMWAAHGGTPTNMTERAELAPDESWTFGWENTWPGTVRPEVVLRYDDAFGDQWETREDGTLTLYAPRPISRANGEPRMPPVIEPIPDSELGK